MTFQEYCARVRESSPHDIALSKKSLCEDFANGYEVLEAIPGFISYDSDYHEIIIFTADDILHTIDTEFYGMRFIISVFSKGGIIYHIQKSHRELVKIAYKGGHYA